ncbi:circadian clock-controlled protein daywake-like [Rhynchophorus ferrugineus]|uniref:circadian clock-controlled protein daywake-like n=1 Tax=Rhynchophorus ferrugineus TaxID=354439 RepID=UPI003FCDAAC3
MRSIYGLLLVVCLLGINGEKSKSKSLPSYIKACSRSADLSACALKHGTESIQHILKGDSNFKSPSLTPWFLERVEAKTGGLELTLTNASVHGLEKTVLKNIKIDVDKKHVDLEVFMKTLRVDSLYKVNGQILVLPIKGEGPSEFIFNDCTFDYSFDYELTQKKDGKTYMANIKPKTSFKIENGHFQIDNLFDGNKALGDNINKVLNENSQEAIGELGQIISDVVNLAATTIIKSYLLSIPFDEIILP